MLWTWFSLKMSKPTPETYEEMNREFAEEGIPFEFAVPTQEAIDKWWNTPPKTYSTPPQIDMVAEMWKKHNQCDS